LIATLLLTAFVAFYLYQTNTELLAQIAELNATLKGLMGG